MSAPQQDAAVLKEHADFLEAVDRLSRNRDFLLVRAAEKARLETQRAKVLDAHADAAALWEEHRKFRVMLENYDALGKDVAGSRSVLGIDDEA